MRVFMGSGDLMPRNLDHRVELVAPVEEPPLRDELVDVIERALADNTNAWTLGPEGRWTRRRPDGEPRNSQAELYKLQSARASDAPTGSGTG